MSNSIAASRRSRHNRKCVGPGASYGDDQQAHRGAQARLLATIPLSVRYAEDVATPSSSAVPSGLCHWSNLAVKGGRP